LLQQIALGRAGIHAGGPLRPVRRSRSLTRARCNGGASRYEPRRVWRPCSLTEERQLRS
jgi:hypothetical protein